MQIAGVPGRHEPDEGEINYPYLLDLLDRLGYDGWVGCEYRPAGDTKAGLAWARRWGIAVKIVITGGAGFIGQRLARRLLARGALAGPDGHEQAIDELVLFDAVPPQPRSTTAACAPCAAISATPRSSRAPSTMRPRRSFTSLPW